MTTSGQQRSSSNSSQEGQSCRMSNRSNGSWSFGKFPIGNELPITLDYRLHVFAGSVKVVPRRQVKLVPVTLDKYSLALMHFGLGLSETLEKTRSSSIAQVCKIRTPPAPAASEWMIITVAVAVSGSNFRLNGLYPRCRLHQWVFRGF